MKLSNVEKSDWNGDLVANTAQDLLTIVLKAKEDGKLKDGARG